MVHPLALAFRRLPTDCARYDGLTALLEELTVNEWRQLHAAMAARDLCSDIVGQLPVELLPAIFCHLDAATPFRLQRVSRQWHHRLQTPSLLTLALADWHEAGQAFRSLDYAGCRASAQHLHALRTGRPRRCFRLALHEPTEASVLVGHNLIWLPQTSFPRELFLLRLDNGRLHTITTEARHVVLAFAASDHLLAIATLDRFFVFALDDDDDHLKRKEFRIAGLAFRHAIACRGSRVACAASFAQYVDVYLWHYPTQIGTSFRLARHPDHPFFALDPVSPYSLALLLHPDDNTLTIFAHADPPNPVSASYHTVPSPLLHGRFTYKGACVSHASWMPPPALHAVAPRGGPDQILPVDRSGRFALRMTALQPRQERSVLLLFDENLDHFIPIPHPATTHHRLWTDCPTAWWKDTFYGPEPVQTDSLSPQRLWGCTGNSDGALFRALVELPKRLPASRTRTMMNEHHVVLHAHDSFYLASFVHDGEPPSAMKPICDVEIVPLPATMVTREE